MTWRDIKRKPGQNLVEFALVAVLLLALVLGIVEFGRVWMTFQVVTNAAREGARLAALPVTQAVVHDEQGQAAAGRPVPPARGERRAF